MIGRFVTTRKSKRWLNMLPGHLRSRRPSWKRERKRRLIGRKKSKEMVGRTRTRRMGK